MTRIPSVLPLCVLLFCSLFCSLVCSTVQADEPVLVGRSSCGTSTCHGGVIDRGPAWNHAFSSWMANDPHRGAGLLLRDQDSKAIVHRLNHLSITSPEVFDSILRSRCITCHATPTTDDMASSGLLDQTILHEGVSCEACHGAASEWIDQHVLQAWKGPQRFEPPTGMRDTESIVGRSETCVRCHVGSRRADGLTRDMNHDLIAAGHPVLRFDLLLYNENLPKHWGTASQVEKEFDQSPIRTRRIGRSISLAAAASLSSQRAKDHLQNPGVPWPELADYDCFACHQLLSIAEFKLPSSDRSKSPLKVSMGLPVWNTWHTTNQVELRDQRERLEKLSPHLSQPSDVIEVADGIATIYRKLAQKATTETVDPIESLRATLAQLKSDAPADWHQAAVQYLELDAAIGQIGRSPSTAAQVVPMRIALSKIERLLRFDANRADGDVAEYHSPTKFSPQEFREAVILAFQSRLSLRESLRSPAKTTSQFRPGE